MHDQMIGLISGISEILVSFLPVLSSSSLQFLSWLLSKRSVQNCDELILNLMELYFKCCS